jgi:hypothetical protein
MHATWPTHFILLSFITKIIFSEQNKSQSFSFCNFPHSPITQCISENKFLNTHSTLQLHYIPINCNVILLWLGCLGLSWVMTLSAQWWWHCLPSGHYGYTTMTQFWCLHYNRCNCYTAVTLVLKSVLEFPAHQI